VFGANVNTNTDTDGYIDTRRLGRWSGLIGVHINADTDLF
jgi:hypothetical protein